MENLSGIMRAVLQGFMDSFKGGIIIFYLDKQIKERSKRSSPNKDPKTRRRREPSRDPALMKQDDNFDMKVKIDTETIKKFQNLLNKIFYLIL
ncbi:Protein of unknown function [Gryllus bimaculatus]|nr:Protein of unknown function [Gryllus bimaculatus]